MNDISKTFFIKNLKDIYPHVIEINYVKKTVFYTKTSD